MFSFNNMLLVSIFILHDRFDNLYICNGDYQSTTKEGPGCVWVVYITTGFY